MIKFGRAFLAKLAVLSLAFSALTAQAAEKLYVYNWTEYVPSSLLENSPKKRELKSFIRHLKVMKKCIQS
ncbi:spermidine/putrescine-binding periplasmic protein (SPBP) [Actinobacillus equuli]|nr:spermidine/putrescine-binding periplasmic protein (SPBP) [Actinobacillus equuli]